MMFDIGNQILTFTTSTKSHWLRYYNSPGISFSGTFQEELSVILQEALSIVQCFHEELSTVQHCQEALSTLQNFHEALSTVLHISLGIVCSAISFSRHKFHNILCTVQELSRDIVCSSAISFMWHCLHCYNFHETLSAVQYSNYRETLCAVLQVS